jgi:hypothetical protein
MEEFLFLSNSKQQWKERSAHVQMTEWSSRTEQLHRNFEFRSGHEKVRLSVYL